MYENRLYIVYCWLEYLLFRFFHWLFFFSRTLNRKNRIKKICMYSGIFIYQPFIITDLVTLKAYYNIISPFLQV